MSNVDILDFEQHFIYTLMVENRNNVAPTVVLAPPTCAQVQTWRSFD